MPNKITQKITLLLMLTFSTIEAKTRIGVLVGAGGSAFLLEKIQASDVVNNMMINKYNNGYKKSYNKFNINEYNNSFSNEVKKKSTVFPYIYIGAKADFIFFKKLLGAEIHYNTYRTPYEKDNKQPHTIVLKNSIFVGGRLGYAPLSCIAIGVRAGVTYCNAVVKKCDNDLDKPKTSDKHNFCRPTFGAFVDINLTRNVQLCADINFLIPTVQRKNNDKSPEDIVVEKAGAHIGVSLAYVF